MQIEGNAHGDSRHVISRSECQLDDAGVHASRIEVMRVDQCRVPFGDAERRMQMTGDARIADRTRYASGGASDSLQTQWRDRRD
ncbi:hypothetical protein GCM10011400_30750 [Paraburkholderia caffeinilytica]|uniref:Uncharacterized protein n=1 Tax=Paraburkholderia caffeinilytica TaxID=1761016 RepID=A0ABQ1MP33_9BURK|nr:hypothetical protein GCM10011400_30750 [Paraburkholderia caffeinilytica]